jgi:hypothetical protein
MSFGFHSDLPESFLSFFDYASSSSIVVPYWVLTVFATALGTAPWLPNRFSLRSLLIGITVLALALGTIIATTR